MISAVQLELYEARVSCTVLGEAWGEVSLAYLMYKTIVKSEEAVNWVLTSITRFIEKKLELRVNEEKSKVTRMQQIKYLGYSFLKNVKGQWKSRLHLKSYQKLTRNLK